MHLSSTKRETSHALSIILDRLHAMARGSGALPDERADLKAILLGMPGENRSQILLVLESLESRARVRDDEGMAQAARLVRNAADQVWAEQREDDLLEPSSAA
jgi:hypothetical protein